MTAERACQTVPFMRQISVITGTCLVLLWGSARAELAPKDAWFVHGEGHLSVFTDLADRSLIAGTFGYGLRGGRRWANGWGAFLHLEQDLWLTTELDKEVTQGAYNVGPGGELVFAGGRVRTALALGLSILAFDTALDPAGNVGLFLDARPLGVRWAVGEQLTLGLDPIGFALVAPALGGIPLVRVEYRSGLYLEWTPPW